MSDKRLPAEGGDRIDNHPTSPCSRDRGNGYARQEVFGCPIQTDEEDIRIDMLVKRSKRPLLHTKLDSLKEKMRGKYLCVRAEIALWVSDYARDAVTIDDRTEPGAKGYLRINVRISSKLYPKLYALLKPLSGEERSELLQSFASTLLRGGHGR